MNNDFNFIINPNFNWDNFAGIFDTKVYVVDKDGNEKELPEKYIIKLPSKTRKQMWEENAIEELKEYFALPYEIQKKYAPMYSPGALKFLYLKNVSEKISKRKLNKGKLRGDVLRTEGGMLFTIEDIKIKENI